MQLEDLFLVQNILGVSLFQLLSISTHGQLFCSCPDQTFLIMTQQLT
jgi:hypothetical protein